MLALRRGHSYKTRLSPGALPSSIMPWISFSKHPGPRVQSATAKEVRPPGLGREGCQRTRDEFWLQLTFPRSSDGACFAP